MVPNIKIINERVDDIPLLIRQMDEMGLEELVDEQFKTHGNWEGASLGRVIKVWLSHILSEGDHRLSYVEQWVKDRQMTLATSLGDEIRALEYSDDRLADVLRLLSDDEKWSEFEKCLTGRLVRVYELDPKQVRLDATTVSGHWQVTENGLFQYGHSKDHRPDLPQLKVMMATLDNLGLPAATLVVDGSRADDPLYQPAIEAVRDSLGQRGLLYVGDSKMAALPLRRFIEAGYDYYLCPLPQLQLPTTVLHNYLEAVWRDEQAVQAIFRQQTNGQIVHIADGFEVECPCSLEIEGQMWEWTERHLVVRSLKMAQKQERALQQRLIQAQQAITELNEAKRGRSRPQTVAQWQQELKAIIERYRVQGLLTCHYQVSTVARQVRRYGDRPAHTWLEYKIQVSAFVNERALHKSCRYFGWRVYATNTPQSELPLEQAVLAYRDQYTEERSFGRLKNKPLSLSPMFLHRDDHATGLVRLLSLALRLLTLLEFSVRRQLALDGSALAGLYPGNPQRTTPRPTAERLLKAFDNVTLSIIYQDDHTSSYITPLSPLQLRILTLLGFSSDIYTRFYSIFFNPP